MNFLKKIWTAVRDVYFFVFRYSSECQLRAQEKKNVFKGEESYLKKFSSYAELKKYQKRTKIFLVGIFLSAVIFGVIFLAVIIFLVQYLYSIFNLQNNFLDWGKIKESIREKSLTQEIAE
ncbi:MAG: hypothetical protein Athens071425_498 [Parcubacteria group bacterium Athens0714_25]|nr:MAG: hypothetical protein Athens071425_498 [Parcubacteria group bacterium Athens0714_25]